jgi:hypothetical protein
MIPNLLLLKALAMRFELTVASKDSFCNRDEKRKILRDAMMDGTPIWIQAPRRYGKTSLVRQSASELIEQDQPISIAPVDFMLCVSLGECCTKIVYAVEQQISELATTPDQMFAKMQKIFSRSLVQFVDNKFTIKLRSKTEATKLEVEDAIMGLDALLKEMDRRVVIHLDEFQQLGELDPSFSIEGVIRHCLEKTKNISFVFSGSNRHLMEQAMSATQRPLYHHTLSIKLDRISEADYTKHIQNAAIEVWGKELEDNAVSNIFMFAQRHAYFTSALCRSAFTQATLPTAFDITRHWKEVVDQDLTVIQNEIKSITKNMVKVVKGLAMENAVEVTSTAFAERVGVKVGSLSAAVKSLHEMDIIEKRGLNGEWALLSPSMEYFIRSNRIE